MLSPMYLHSLVKFNNFAAFSTVAAKDIKPRKHQRDKNLSKLAAMSRRLETSSNMVRHANL